MDENEKKEEILLNEISKYLINYYFKIIISSWNSLMTH